MNTYIYQEGVGGKREGAKYCEKEEISLHFIHVVKEPLLQKRIKNL